MAETALIIGIILVVGIIWLRRPSWSAPKTQPPNPNEFQHFQDVDSVFASRAEYVFFHTLSASIPSEFHVLTKIRLEDVIGVRRDVTDGRLKWRLRGRIKSRHIDFLIIDRSGKPRIAIELDGPHHTNDDARNADALKNGLFKASSIQFYRVKTGENFKDFSNSLAQKLKSP